MADPAPALVHLARRADWQAACASPDRTYRVSTIGATLDRVGFIHLSRPDQVDGVAARFYDGVGDLVLLDVDAAATGAEVVWEPVGDDTFPHLVGPLPVDAVTSVRPYRP
ncbi:MAG TPA: DUF952 domain-containing protein [Acidimicrobiales bacterium]|nr:DUF952 domain-containing protein [Acidimicrobiales bacterium]